MKNKFISTSNFHTGGMKIGRRTGGMKIGRFIILYRCEYFRESVLMNSLLVDNNPVRLTESGSFKVDLLMYTDATYTQEHRCASS